MDYRQYVPPGLRGPLDDLMGMGKVVGQGGYDLLRAIQQDPRAVNQAVGDSMVGGIQGAVTDPIGTVKGVYDDVTGTVGRALTNTAADYLPEGVTMATATAADITSANDARYADLASTMAMAVPGAKALKVGAKAASNVDYGGLAADATYAGRSIAEGDFSDALTAFRPGGEAKSLGAAAPSDNSPNLLSALEARADQMQFKPTDRIQPAPGGAGIFDRDYQTPAPSGAFEDLSLKYPRNPDPSASLPKGDRARILVDQREAISSALADRIRATGQLEADTRYFYHTDGPVYRAAKEAGLSDAEAQAYLRDLSNNVAATSPRTKVEENLRNATLVMAKDAQGIPFRDVVGPGTIRPDGTKGISEKGYPMMTAKGGIHGGLLDDVAATGTMDVARNPKPSNFGANLSGNRSGVTMDTHAIRGTLMTLNEMQPGSVPDGFILPKFRDQYVKDPSVLTPNMIDDTLASQMTGPKGNTTKLQTEYPVFADIWHDAAAKLGVSPAEAQSMGWFGFGDETNLGSARKTPVDIFDDRLSVTAQALDVTPQQAARSVFRRQIPLLAAPFAAAPLLGMQGQQDPRQQQ
tara:strand:+ start:1857 stop:3593 length:1737 start_codon:yes stop_codon:yes gene_type:complete